jgi:glycosyltransferase involved in cell wall biosynthesis
MKIAIIHDDLMRRGGGEQVAICFHKAFPKAPIFTSVYQPELTYPDFKKATIYTSWYQKLVKSEKWMKWLFFPFGLLAMKSFKIDDEYDVILISTTYSGKYIKLPPKALVITYCYTPFRLAWNPTSYSEYLNAKGIIKWLFDFVVNTLRKIDKKSSERTNYFVAMTQETKQRIADAYEPTNAIKVIPPPVNFANYSISDKVGDYYLLVSRLEYYKKVDLAIDAFNELGYKLIVVGRGSKKEELKKRAKDNITFMEGLDNKTLSELYQGCKAFIFPQHEDYGITPLEANAAGRPVIAYRAGGVLETMIPYEDNASKATAIFFDKQEPTSLIDAVRLSEKLSFDPYFLRENAERFTEEKFIEAVRDFVESKYEAFTNKEMIESV